MIQYAASKAHKSDDDKPKTINQKRKREEKMTKAELNEKIVRYATANEQKNAVAAEVKDLGDEIK